MLTWFGKGVYVRYSKPRERLIHAFMQVLLCTQGAGATYSSRVLVVNVVL